MKTRQKPTREEKTPQNEIRECGHVHNSHFQNPVTGENGCARNNCSCKKFIPAQSPERKYILKDKDELVFTGKLLREFKQKVIGDYKKTEYPATAHRRFRRQGFIEAVDGLRQWIINEGTLDPEPCCHGVKIEHIIRKLDEWKKQGDKRFVLDQKHIIFIKQMLKEGYSQNQIAKELKVSSATISYWVNPRYRRRQMEKNAKRKFGKKLKAPSNEAKT